MRCFFIVFLIFASSSAFACSVADVCGAGCKSGEYFSTFECKCVPGDDPYGCTDKEIKIDQAACSDVKDLNKSCTSGTSWDDNTCSCKPIAESKRY